jgi:hypothetical protein
MAAECSNDGSSRLTDLASQFGPDTGTHLGDWGLAHGYAAIYEWFLAVRRFEPLRLLEIGVWKAGSLRMWESYLPNARILRIESSPDVVQERAERAEILIGDAADEQFLNDVLCRFSGGKIDLVIDHASHILDQQIRTFETLFPFVEEDGLYFVEEVSGSRFQDGNRGLRPFQDFLDYSWNLAQQATFFPDLNTSADHQIRAVKSLSRSERDQTRVSFWNSDLGSVHFFHNLCVVEKLHRKLEIEDLKRSDPLRPNSGRMIEKLANGRESEGTRMEQEFAEIQSTNAALTIEVARLKAQLKAARGKLKSVWDFIFRLQAEHVAETAQLKVELTTMSPQVSELQKASEELQRQKNVLRLQNADWKHLVRWQIARLLTSKRWPFQRLIHFKKEKQPDENMSCLERDPRR